MLQSESNKKSANKNSNSKTKAERKRSGKLSSSIGKKDKGPGDKLEHSAADDTTEDEEEDDEELVEKSQSDVNSPEHISSTNRTVLPELASQAAMLNQQTSGSTEDMFTPVISKHSKRRNKKAGISNLSKDDLAQTSSSLASSKTSSAIAASSGQNTSYAASSYSSIFSAKPANVEMLNVEKFKENLKIVDEQTSEFKYNNQGLNENLDQNAKLEGKVQNLEGKIQKIEESRLCKICLDREVSQIFLPCGHSICCNKCAIGLQICPICRGNIRKSQIIYFS